MPFSVLRVWGLGVLGWALLGLGVYLGYETYREFSRPVAIAVEPKSDLAIQSEINREVLRERQPLPQNWKKWAFLGGCAVCIAISVGGYLPIRFFLGKPMSKSAAELSTDSSFMVDRPDGSQLHVEIYGQTKGPTLLLTHGWSLDGTAWDYVKTDLARNHRLVVWELAGMGRSRGPTNHDFSLDKMARDLEAVLQATCAGSPVILVGHSIGGMVSQTFCRIYAKQLGSWVQGIVLLHTTYTNPLRTNLAATFTTAVESAVIVPLNYVTIYLAPVAWLSNWQSYFNGSLHVFTRFASFSGKQTREQVEHGARLAAEAWPAAVARGNLGMLKFNEEATLPQVEIPVLVIGGIQDRMTLHSASEHLQNLLPNDRPFSVDGGHLGHWEQSARVSEAIGEFATQLFTASPAVIRDSQVVAE
ncbi:Arylesterase [Anatilimnocola aggregata]|uniref:Arylesterase n=1 Tax=Anatilimnocola aggregata TaxID=2528021 RepID=A0A517Y527_9BACT|nr:alpha/beta hydrolase [Anatilimnocola aggregata]QDU25306.1 Arylesterase [Anatilimnocola aggregata]